MQPNVVRDLLLGMENRYPVNQWSAQGVRVWPYLRSSLVRRIEARQLIEGLEPPAKGWGAVKRRLGAVRSKLVKNVATYGARRAAGGGNTIAAPDSGTAVAFSNGISFVPLGETMFEKVMEPLLHSLGERGLSPLLLTPEYSFPHPCKVPQIFIQAGLDVVACRGILGRCPHFREEQFDGLDAFFAELAESDIPGARMDEAEFRKGLGHVFRFSDYFFRLLDKCRARVGFLTNFNGEAGMGFVLACRRLGIPCVGVPHGMQADYSLYYCYWYSTPPEGYELLPERQWVHADKDAAKYRDWMDGTAHDVIVGGDPFLQEWLDGSGRCVAEYDARLMRMKQRAEGLCVLVALNGQREAEDDLVADVIEESLHRGVDMTFWLRSHPCRPEQSNRLRARLPKSLQERCVLDGPSLLPLYALLRHADVLLTRFSSTAVEAAKFGVRTVYLDAFGREAYANRLPEEMCVYAPTPQEGVDRLLAQAACRGAGVEESSGEYYEAAVDRLYELVRNREAARA